MYESLFAALQQFTAVPDAELAKARGLFCPVQFDKGIFVVRAGETPDTIAFVVSGLLRLFYNDADGKEFTKSFCTENSFLASYSSLLLNKPSRIFIETLEESTLLIANYADYQTLADEHPCWQIINRKLAEMLFIKKELRESELVLDDATTRYRNFQAEYPGLENRVKQYHIASYLGITPVALSRIRKQLDQN